MIDFEAAQIEAEDCVRCYVQEAFDALDDARAFYAMRMAEHGYECDGECEAVAEAMRSLREWFGVKPS